MPAITKCCEGCKTNFLTKWHRARFCTVSCSNKFLKRRKKKITICSFESCTNPVDYHMNVFCRECRDLGRHFFPKQKGKILSELTIEEYCSRKGANRFDGIRGHARNTIKRSGRELKCESCGWDHHVEVCHIKAISDYPPTTLVSVVNESSNLKLLCPNCHWLFDNKK
jgi:hypothetical protein